MKSKVFHALAVQVLKTFGSGLDWAGQCAKCLTTMRTKVFLALAELIWRTFGSGPGQAGQRD